LLDLASTVDRVDAIALSGGSAFGIDAGGGIQAWLAEQGRGLRIREAVIPIVPGAIVFDLLNGGDKAWGRFAPYRDLGYAAALAASDDFALGSVGAGLGATTATFKGGLGSASAVLANGIKVAASMVVNAIDGAGEFEQRVFARAGSAAANIDGRNRVGVEDDRGRASGDFRILGMADADAGDIGEKVFQGGSAG
jgi:L-aminopeptidase/D-esterase-like protein